MVEPVLIAGAGPTGLMAALELARLGIRVRLIDKLEVPVPNAPEQTRAIGLQARTLELFDQRGLSEELLRRGDPIAICSVYGGGRRLFQFDFSGIASRHNYILFVSQEITEKVLREAIAKLGVTLEHGVELAAFAQDAHGVKAVLRHADGRLEQAQAPWLIDTGGAHSIVRSTLALPFTGRAFDRHFVLGDVNVDGELSDKEFHLCFTERGFLGLFPLGPRRFRIIADNPFSTAEKDTAPTLEELQSIFDLGSPCPGRLTDMRWSSRFHINNRMVSHLRVGHVLLGGDAAHIHSPAAAQGMNTGIQDMVNLAWKLALVIKGEAPMTLLDTYERERLAVMRNVLNKTEKITELMGSKAPTLRILFEGLGPWIGQAQWVQQLVPFRVSQIAINYRTSPLSVQHGWTGRLRAGDRVPDLLVQSSTAWGAQWKESTLLKLLDPSRFTLLIARPEAFEAASSDWREAVEPWKAVIDVIEIAQSDDPAARARFEELFGPHGAMFLVRPDGYIGFAGDEHASVRQLEAYCAKWLIAQPAESRRAA